MKHKNLKNFVIFIGHPRTGHSLIGSLLDAHPNALIAHEEQIVDMVIANKPKDEICDNLIENSKKYALNGRVQKNTTIKYDYTLEGLWQGESTDLQVLGDKSGGMATRRIEQDFSLLNKTKKHLKTPIKLIYVLRNPFDCITTDCVRRKRPLNEIIGKFISACSTNQKIIESSPNDVIIMKHEDFISDPPKHLKMLCDFLGLTYDDYYINMATSIVYKKPRQSRDQLKWNKSQKQKINKTIQKYAFLNGYSYD